MKIFIMILKQLMPVAMAGMLLFACQPKRPLCPDDGLGAIKILNSDLVNFSAKSRENPAFIALGFLIKEASSPLSIESGLPWRWLNDTLSSLNEFAGKYDWSQNCFVKTADIAGLEVNFTLPGVDNSACQFFMPDFDCQAFSSGLCFPTLLNARINLGDEEILQIKQFAEIRDALPALLELNISGRNFEGELTASRTRLGEEGTLDVSFEFRAGNYQILEGRIHSIIGYNGNQIFYKTYEPDLNIFDVHISGMVDYGKVDPTSKEYIKSFNDNCHIVFVDSRSGRKIGDFGIGAINNNELLGWVLYLSDGSFISLEEHLLVLKESFNYKLPNK